VDGISDGIDKIGIVWPDQDGNGAHMNLSGGGVAAHAPNRDNAVKFLEYLTSESAQAYFSEGNDEFPVVAGVPLAKSVEQLGTFKADTVNLSDVAKNIPTAQRIFNAVGWE
jgi:iron(III) transport system substrate-binding protein